MAKGRLVEPTAKTSVRTDVELPEYDEEGGTISHEGKTLEAKDGTKFITEDGQTFVLHFARTIPGGWKRARVMTDEQKRRLKAGRAKKAQQKK